MAGILPVRLAGSKGLHHLQEEPQLTTEAKAALKVEFNRLYAIEEAARALIMDDPLAPLLKALDVTRKVGTKSLL